MRCRSIASERDVMTVQVDGVTVGGVQFKHVILTRRTATDDDDALSTTSSLPHLKYVAALPCEI